MNIIRNAFFKKPTSRIMFNQKRLFSSQNDKFMALDNPYTGELIEKVPFFNKEQIEQTLQKAEQAYKENKFRKLDERKQIVQGLIDYLKNNKEQIATDITQQMGKPITQSREEIDQACHRSQAFIEMSDEALQKEIVENSQKHYKYIIKEPIGTVLILNSYDFPILSSINHMIPAILSGNSVLLKEHPRTAIIAKHLEKGCSDTNIAQYFFPEQNSVKQLYKHQNISYVVFMGSLQSAKFIYSEVANNDFIDIQLDLGGKDAAYVNPDIDIEKTASKLVRGAFYNTGQTRHTIERIYVHQDIYSEFINTYTKKVFEELKLGDPMKEDTNIGPIATSESVEFLQQVCEEAIQLGSQVLVGGNTNSDDQGQGRFFEPTVIANATNGMKVMQDQIFGPLVAFQEVESQRQAKELINSSRYGLTTSIFSNDQVTCDYFTGAIKVGVINFNHCPVMQDHYLPVTGRKLCSKILYNSKYAFSNFTKLKSINYRFN